MPHLPTEGYIEYPPPPGVVIAFRMNTKLFSFRKEVPNRWIIIRNGATKLGLFPDLISTSLLGATGLSFNYHEKLNIAV